MKHLNLELWDTDCRPGQVGFAIRSADDTAVHGSMVWVDEESWKELGSPSWISIKPAPEPVACDHRVITRTSYDGGYICTDQPACHKRFDVKEA